MAIVDLADWFDTFARPNTIWFAKRLSANDTGLTGGHQGGPLIAKDYLLKFLPDVDRREKNIYDCEFDLVIDSHAQRHRARAVWYWSKREGRFTRVGAQASPFMDADNTGTLAVFVTELGEDGTPGLCHAWVCEGNGTEADLIEERLGPVEPKQFLLWEPGAGKLIADLFGPRLPIETSCILSRDQMPEGWLEVFPSGRQIVQQTLQLRPPTGMSPDVRLLKRRECEYEIFRSIEEVYHFPQISQGFDSISTFIALANTVLQSRKARSGRSLEYHALEIFQEEGFVAATDFVYGPTIEGGKRPDFLFPTIAAYEDQEFPESRLRMLAAKTTCKDRWRQILNEADRVKNKHLLTLQEGVSVNQFNEMTEAGVMLVVPAGLHRAYPEAVRPHLTTLEEFIGDVRLLNAP